MGNKRNRNQVRDVALYVQSNRPTEDHYKMLQQFYRASALNQISLMEARNLDDPEDKPVLLLVCNVVDEKGVTHAVPVAKLLMPHEFVNFRAPDGRGGWVEPPSKEVKTNESAS